MLQYEYVKFSGEYIMTIKTATVRARIAEDLKENVGHVLNKLGLTISDAINMFMAQIKLKKGIPFDIIIPNRTTRKTFESTDKGKNLYHSKNAKEMFDKLGI